MLLATGPTAPPLGPGVDSLVVQQSVLVASLEPTARMVASEISCFISIFKSSLVHSHWSRNVEAWLLLDES